jgi:DNA-binding beta-propeller fold protein YncE
MRQLEPGEEIAGYRIEAVVDRGGMGVVYRATQLALDRQVALKVIAPEFAADEEFRRRFERESRTAGSIRHPNVITIYDAREDEGLLFITMDYIEGTDLRAVLAEEGSLDPERAVDLVTQVASALDAAHARGLIHRDVKPANVLIADESGGEHAYLTDFGLSKATGKQSSLTQTGGMLGTTDYAAPEQLEGEPVDARADVYSLACVLFEVLTGRVPFARDTQAAKMWAHVSAEPPSVREAAPELPREFDDVVRRGMAKRADERYPSAGDLARAATAAAESRSPEIEERSVAVGDAAGDESTRLGRRAGLVHRVPAPGSKAAREPRLTRRRLAALLAAGAAATLVVVLLVGGVLSGESEKGPRNPAGRVAGPPIEIIPEPRAMDVADGGVWIAGGPRRESRVTRVDAATKAVDKPIPIEFPAHELEVGEGAVWVNACGSITRIDPRTKRVTLIPLPTKVPPGALEGAEGPPIAIAVGQGGLWVANNVDGTVRRLDPRSNEFGRPIRVGRGLGPIAVTERAILVGVGKSVRAIDPERERVEPGEPIPTKLKVEAFEQAENFVYALEGDPNKEAIAQPIDTATGIVGRAITAREGPADFTTGGGSAWVSYAPEGTIDRVDLVSGKRIGEPIRVGTGTLGLAFGEGSLWAANHNTGTLTRIEP